MEESVQESESPGLQWGCNLRKRERRVALSLFCVSRFHEGSPYEYP
ncbi:hypothetical protein HMPREF9441_00167 [Paraprevotella clara YIT 11840]|uniref:Uncharacterized protein n=1 Tax=Paraprevotella clara YIT 11840 TaxID=762968 RepID=G5SLE8_9BACT|nr:hypothetical protein HMPREF9441_00167 [Paraprevotella clara YIT 11840]